MPTWRRTVRAADGSGFDKPASKPVEVRAKAAFQYSSQAEVGSGPSRLRRQDRLASREVSHPVKDDQRTGNAGFEIEIPDVLTDQSPISMVISPLDEGDEMVFRVEVTV